MIRLTHVLTSTAPGGAERLAVHVLRHLDRSRYAPSVLLLYEPAGSDLDALLAASDIPIRSLHKSATGAQPRVFVRAWRALAALRPDVVHTHGYPLAYVLPALIGQRLPAVHTVHTEATEESARRTSRWLHRLAFSTRVQPVFASRSIQRSFEQVYPHRHGVVIENGIPLAAHVDADGAAWRRAQGLDADDLIVLFVGRLEPVKQPVALVEAFAAVARAVPRARLVLAGDGTERAAVERAAAASPCADRIHLLGFRDDVPAALAAADVMALNSRYEGLPLAVIEAMAAGVPVVAPAVGGLPEAIGDADAGALFPPGDGDALAAALIALLTDPAARARHGDAGRRSATERYAIEATTARYAALYERLAAR